MQAANNHGHLIPGKNSLALRRLSGWICCVIVLLWMADMSYGRDTTGLQEAEHPAANSTKQLPQITVTERRPISAATESRVREKDFAVRPHNTASEMLNNLPGFVAGQHAGGGKAKPGGKLVCATLLQSLPAAHVLKLYFFQRRSGAG